MRPITPRVKKQILADPYYNRCARANIECAGRVTWEHCFIYAGRQINEKWAILPLCAFHHSVDKYQDGKGLNKRLNQFLALKRATADDLAKYPRTDWVQLIIKLTKEFQYV